MSLQFVCLSSPDKAGFDVSNVALSEAVWAPLDLPLLVTENIPDPPDRIFWKAALLLPNDHESEASLADR